MQMPLAPYVKNRNATCALTLRPSIRKFEPGAVLFTLPHFDNMHICHIFVPPPDAKRGETYHGKVLLRLSSAFKFSQNLDYDEGNSNSTRALDVCPPCVAVYIGLKVWELLFYPRWGQCEKPECRVKQIKPPPFLYWQFSAGARGTNSKTK